MPSELCAWAGPVARRIPLRGPPVDQVHCGIQYSFKNQATGGGGAEQRLCRLPRLTGCRGTGRRGDRPAGLPCGDLVIRSHFPTSSLLSSPPSPPFAKDSSKFAEMKNLPNTARPTNESPRSRPHLWRPPSYTQVSFRFVFTKATGSSARRAGSASLRHFWVSFHTCIYLENF